MDKPFGLASKSEPVTDNRSGMDEDTWSVEYAGPGNMTLLCPGAYIFHMTAPRHWGEHIIIATSARKIVIANRAEARAPEGIMRDTMDLSRRLAPGQKVAHISVSGGIWKIDLTICEDNSIELGYTFDPTKNTGVEAW